MHSSRMRTARSSSHYWGGVWAWSASISPWVCAWIWSPSISPLEVGLEGGVSLAGGSPWRGVSLEGVGCLLGGGCLLGRGGIPACTEADPPVNRMTDACENITLPQTSFAGGNYTPKQRTSSTLHFLNKILLSHFCQMNMELNPGEWFSCDNEHSIGFLIKNVTGGSRSKMIASSHPDPR